MHSGVSDKDLASAVQDGGYDLWDLVHQLEALRAQWVYRMLRADTATKVPWRTLPATWLCEDLGRWSGLARLRRDAAKFATGYEIIDGW